MYNRNDPRFRRTVNQISHNLESANDAAQVGFFSITEHYVKPCFSSIGSCIQICTAPCFAPREERIRRSRARTRGRPELDFDFYDDWREDENDALLSWSNDEFDRTVVGADADEADAQPRRQNIMSYGSAADTKLHPGRKSSGGGHDSSGASQSLLGLFGKIQSRMPGRRPRYRPSAADLQVRPQRKAGVGPQRQDIDEAKVRGEPVGKGKHGRKRSGTTSSGRTTGSHSSLGDIFPSDDEDDAVPLDDEFTVALGRHTTNSSRNEGRSGRSKGDRHASNSRSSTQSARGGQGSRTSLSNKSSRVPSSEPSPLRMDEVSHFALGKPKQDQAQLQEEKSTETKTKVPQRLTVQQCPNVIMQPAGEMVQSGAGVSPVSPLTPDQSTGESIAFPAIEMDIAKSHQHGAQNAFRSTDNGTQPYSQQGNESQTSHGAS